MQVTAGRTLEFRSVEDHTGAQVREVDTVAPDFPLTLQVTGDGVLSQAFSPLGPHDRNRLLPSRVESIAPNLAARDTHAQIAATTSETSQQPEHRTPQKHWSISWIVLGGAVLFSIAMVLGKAIYARKARQSS